MFRRSRFSVRPNVSTVGRTVTAASQEPSAGNQEATETQKETNESSSAPAVTNKADVISSENPSASGDGNDQSGEGASSSASVQRRKRFSIKPKVAPGRPPVFPRTSKSPVKAASAAPAVVSGSAAEKPSTSSKVPVPHGLQSPRRRRLSEDGKQHKVQPKLTSVCLESQSPSAEDSPEQTQKPTDISKQAENISGNQVKEVPPRLPDRVPPSLPDKEASEISEKAKTLMSSKNVVLMTPSALSLSKLLNDPSDVQRLIKAQKLRELLKQEQCKEKFKKAKARQKEFTLDPTKMTMRDLIHYLPTSNPMTSSLDDSAQENETVLPPSPPREKSPVRAQPEVLPAQTNPMEGEEEEGNAATEEEQEEALMVPQVKVAEDGSLIIDEESLTVEVQRAKGPNPAQDREPIFERGSTTTYSSFKKASYTKPWSIEETDMFFLAVSMVGTDFSMICQLFPHRARSEIKNKFKKEERVNSWRIDKAFREKRKLDIEYFSKLLEKVLEVQKDRKKLKSLVEKNTKKTKAKRKKSAKKLSDVEEEDENDVFESEDGGEKENEEQCNEGEVPASEPKKKRTRKKREKFLTEEPSEKKTKTGETVIPEDSEAALPEDNTNSDMSENVQNANTAKETAIKPAKLSRGRAPKPVVPLGLKRSKKVPPSRKDEDPSSDTVETSLNKEDSDLSHSSKRNSASDISSEEEEAIVKPQKPTRYGRVPKPTQTFMHPSQNDPHASASEAAPAASKPECTKKRKSPQPQLSQKPKKSKLVTLRSSKSDFSDEDSENEDQEGRAEQHLLCSSSKDTESSVFMTSSLHPPNVLVSEVDDTMVELDILDSMPDMLGISQDALCPDSSCQKAQHETGTAEPCEHQLDLLVDVIDFLSSEHTEDSQDESYNEAAQTLLTIGSLTHVSESAQTEFATQDFKTEASPAGVNEFSYLEEEIVLAPPEQNSATSLSSALGQEVTETSQTVATVDLQSSVTDSGSPHTETSDQTCGEIKAVCDINLTPHKSPPVTKARHFTKVKPKPKLRQTSRTSQQTSQKEENNEQEAKESCTLAANQISEITAEEISPKTTESAQALVENTISPTEVKLTEESVTKSCSSSESQFEPSRNQATREKKTSDSTDKRSVSPGERTESGFIEHPSTSPAEDLPVSQKGDVEVATSSKSIGRRLPKVKPKPNLTRTPRPARNKSQISEETVEKDTLPTVKPQSHRQTVVDVEPQPMSTSSSGFKLTEDLPATEEIKTQTEVVNQAAIGATLSDQSATENQNQLRDTRSTSEHTEEKSTSQVETTEKSSKTVTTDPTVTEPPPVGQGLNVDLVLTHEGREDPVTLVTPVEETTVDKGESKVATTCQLRSSRLQKIKPKPNISQTSRAAKSKLQSTEEPIGKDSSADLEFKKNTTSSQKQIVSTDCASGLNPVQISESSITDTDKLSENERTFVEQMDTDTSDHSVLENLNISDVQIKQSEMETSVDLFTDKNLTSHIETGQSHTNDTTTGDSGSVESEISLASNLDSALVQEQGAVEEVVINKHDCEAASTHQFRSRRLSKVKPKPNVPQTSRSAKLKPQTTEEPEKKHLDPESLKKTKEFEPQATCSPSPEKPTVSTNPASGATSPLTPGPSVTPSEELLISQEKEKVKSVCQPMSRSQKIKPKPNLAQISRRTKFKSQVPVETANKDSSPTSAPELDDKIASENTHVEPGGEKDLGGTSAQGTSKNQNPSEVQPEASSDHVTTEMKSSEFNNASLKFDVGTSESGLKNMETSDITKTALEQKQACTTTLPEASSQDKGGDTSLVSVPSQKLVSTPKCREELSSAEDQQMQNAGQVSSSESAEQHKPQRRQRFSKVKPNLGSTSRITHRKLQSDDGKPSDDQHMDSSSPGTSEQQSAKDSTPKFNPAETYSSSGDCKLSTPVTESNITDQTTTDVQSTIKGTASTACPISRETISLVESHDQRPSELTETSKTSREAPQARRGRLIKPKPNLQLSSRPQSTQQVLNTKPTEPDSGSYLKGANASADHRPVSELRPDDQNPVKGVTDELIHKDSSSNDAHPSDNVTQKSTNQNESTSSAGRLQSYPLLSEILPAEVPLDPDEPFFILSLTEIPVSSAGVEVNNSSEQLSHLPVTDSSKHEESVSAESLEAVGDGFDVFVHTATRESSEVCNKDTESEPAGSISEVTTSPLCVNDDPTNHQVQKTETLTSKQTSKGPGRKGKLPAKSTATRKKQISHAASESESGCDKTVTETRDGAGDHIDTDKKAVSSEREPDGCSASQTAQSVGRTRQSRAKAKSCLPSVSESSTRKRLQKPTAAKKTSAEPSVSMSSDVPTKTRSHPSTDVYSSPPDVDQTSEHHPTRSNPAPSIQHRPAEVLSLKEDDSATELTNVSQYFLSDIFTEVEDE